MTILTLILLLISGLLTPSADHPSPSPTCEPTCGSAGQIVTGPGYTGAILPEAAADSLIYSTFADHFQSWTPTEQDIARFEADWHAYARTMEIAQAPSDPFSADGYRQYAGFIRDGQHYILANSFCTMRVTEGIDWTREPVVVMDGGACFYRVTYNVDTGEFSHLSVNGPA